MKEYRVSAPMFVLPYLTITAENKEEVKKKYIEKVSAKIVNAFWGEKAVDVRLLDDTNNDGWEIEEEFSEKIIVAEAARLFKDDTLRIVYLSAPLSIYDNEKATLYVIKNDENVERTVILFRGRVWALVAENEYYGVCYGMWSDGCGTTIIFDDDYYAMTVKPLFVERIKWLCDMAKEYNYFLVSDMSSNLLKITFYNEEIITKVEAEYDGKNILPTTTKTTIKENIEE